MVERFTIGSKWPKHADTPVVFASDYEALVKERDTLAADKAELLAALELARTEMIDSGNWDAKDYGWPKARQAVEAALARHAAPAKETEA